MSQRFDKVRSLQHTCTDDAKDPDVCRGCRAELNKRIMEERRAMIHAAFSDIADRPSA